MRHHGRRCFAWRPHRRSALDLASRRVGGSSYSLMGWKASSFPRRLPSASQVSRRRKSSSLAGGCDSTGPARVREAMTRKRSAYRCCKSRHRGQSLVDVDAERFADRTKKRSLLTVGTGRDLWRWVQGDLSHRCSTEWNASASGVSEYVQRGTGRRTAGCSE